MTPRVITPQVSTTTESATCIERLTWARHGVTAGSALMNKMGEVLCPPGADLPKETRMHIISNCDMFVLWRKPIG